MDTQPLNAGKENYRVSWSKVYVHYEQRVNKRNCTVCNCEFDRSLPSIAHVLLGLFHLMQRITDTMNPKCECYWKALVDLKKSFYKYIDEDFALLITALRKCIHEAATTIHNLELFLDKYTNASDDSGTYLFSKKTEEVVREQMKKVRFASDPPGFEMYQKIHPSRNSNHRLIKYQSLRPESNLRRNRGWKCKKKMEMQHQQIATCRKRNRHTPALYQ